jgi:hypothetical protein
LGANALCRRGGKLQSLSLRPPPIQPPMLNRLGQVLLVDKFPAHQLSDGPCDLKAARVAGGREAQAAPLS